MAKRTRSPAPDARLDSMTCPLTVLEITLQGDTIVPVAFEGRRSLLADGDSFPGS